MAMVESLIVGLVLAAVSGVSFIAYKHPASFALVFPSAVVVISFFSVKLCTYQLGIAISSASSISRMAAELPTAPLSSIATDATLLHSSIKFLGGTIIAYVGIVAYLFLLRRLPKLLATGASN